MSETEGKVKSERTFGYRIWLTPDTVQDIHDLADFVHVDHKRVMAVWVSEMVQQKKAQLGMVSALTDMAAGLLAEQLEREAGAIDKATSTTEAA